VQIGDVGFIDTQDFFQKKSAKLYVTAVADPPYPRTPSVSHVGASVEFYLFIFRVSLSPHTSPDNSTAMEFEFV
jgi:hypothetical protein